MSALATRSNSPPAALIVTNMPMTMPRANTMPKLSTVFLFSLRKSFTTPRAALSPVIFISKRYVGFFLFMPTPTDTDLPIFG